MILRLKQKCLYLPLYSDVESDLTSKLNGKKSQERGTEQQFPSQPCSRLSSHVITLNARLPVLSLQSHPIRKNLKLEMGELLKTMINFLSILYS